VVNLSRSIYGRIANAANTIAINIAAETNAEIQALFKYEVGTSGTGGKSYASGSPRITEIA
jgi:hypothetical protein